MVGELLLAQDAAAEVVRGCWTMQAQEVFGFIERALEIGGIPANVEWYDMPAGGNASGSTQNDEGAQMAAEFLDEVLEDSIIEDLFGADPGVPVVEDADED
jgi:hypothetical protein